MCLNFNGCFGAGLSIQLISWEKQEFTFKIDKDMAKVHELLGQPSYIRVYVSWNASKVIMFVLGQTVVFIHSITEVFWYKYNLFIF